MREIIYRGIPKESFDGYAFSQIWKDNCEGSFVYGSLLISNDRYYICVSAMCKINCCINNGMTSMIEVIPESVGQFTGLTDKNGKNIFEGDVVKVVVKRDIYDRNDVREEKGLIGYDAIGMLSLILYFHNDEPVYSDVFNELSLSNCVQDFHFEVIGNIHDNPELLKE